VPASARRRLGSWALALGLAACGGGDGGEAQDGAPGGGGGGDPAAELFDEDVVRTYRVTVAAADWDWLNDNAILEEYVPASLELDGEVFAAAAIRYKGNYGSLYRCFDAAGNRTGSCDKLSLKLSFNEYDAGGKFRGLKKLNLHAMDADPSKMHDAIGYTLFRDHGVPAPRTAYANLEVNGEPLGLFVVVENVDGRFTRSRFPDGGEGNLYKEVWPVTRDPAVYLAGLVTNEDEGPSVDRMVRFAGALEAAGDAGFVTTLEAWTDVDQLVDYFAVARLIDHWDDVVAWYCFGGSCFNHNFYWYESTAEDKVWLIAWDLDHSFEEPSPIRTFFGMPDWDEVDASCDPIPLFGGVSGRAPACDPILRRVVTQLWDRYAAASQALIDGDFAPAALGARIDRLEALLADHVAADPVLDAAAWRSGVTALRRAVDAKRSYIVDKLR
jgi:spore coat protein H